MLKLPPSCAKKKDIKLADIWREIQSGVLSGKGSAFSFEYTLSTETVTYKRNPHAIIPRWKVHEKKKMSDRVTFELMLMKFGDGISYTKSAICNKDTRDGSDRNAIYAEVQNGFIYLIRVSEEYARYVFRENYGEGIAFCNRLLTKHQDLLIEIIERERFIKVERTQNIISYLPAPNESTPGNRFAVECGAIIAYRIDYFGEWFSRPIFFSNYGMDSLKNIQECYGLALALMETAYKLDLISPNKTQIRFYRESKDVLVTNDELDRIAIEYSAIEKPSVSPVLNEWQ